MRRNRDKDLKMTAEEKEMLRRLMETPGIENEWDFFRDMNKEVPLPEYFMRGEPERRYRWGKYVAVGAGLTGIIGVGWIILKALGIKKPSRGMNLRSRKRQG